MTERNELVVNLVEHADETTRVEIFTQLFVIRDKEDEYLIPYRQELQQVKTSLINLNHTQQYSEASAE
jgi:hypothetical protein